MTTRLLHILPADNTPEVFLDPEGIIKIKGRGMVLNKTTIPYQINGWIDGYLLNPPEITNIIIAFEYLNSHSATIFGILYFAGMISRTAASLILPD